MGMGEKREAPRVFGVPPGADFSTEVVSGLLKRFHAMKPHEFAKTLIYVNTARMQKSLHEAFANGPALLIPQIRLFSELPNLTISTLDEKIASPLRQKLELSNLISKLLDVEPEIAPRSSLYPLADSLVRLFDEMESEQVSFETLMKLDIQDQSGHWQRSLKFLEISAGLFDTSSSTEARLIRSVNNEIAQWQENEPDYPILFVGSTASRKTARTFMKAIAKLRLGSVVLPGFDFCLDQSFLEKFEDAKRDSMHLFEDHPQFRLLAFLNEVGLSHEDVSGWTDASGVDRNRLISLSLHPAPVTDHWMDAGPKLGDLVSLTQEMTLVEATSTRQEAETIALRLRQSAQTGKIAALVSPDRNLTRQVAAALDRWDLKPDDSAGIPLHLSAPGRLLRHTVELLMGDPSAEHLLTLLKHPLVHSGREDRGDHLLRTRELEIFIRKKSAAVVTVSLLQDWCEKRKKTDDVADFWVDWIVSQMFNERARSTQPLKKWLSKHVQISETICAGPNLSGSGDLWQESAGRKALEACQNLEAEAEFAGNLTATEYLALISKILSDEVVRDRDAGHPNILILGALEARIQNAELVILGGMNETIWPASPQADPWLNRTLRSRAGLLSPERQIGLSAHDYQQAVAAKEVWITRSLRNSDSETVPSRWINRLINLIQGLPENGGTEALKRMRNRGHYWLDQANRISANAKRIPRATRPSPRPPVGSRPRELSVTKIKNLIRDPYAIYAEKILKLRPLDQLSAHAEARLRGIIFHKILEDFSNECLGDQVTLNNLLEIASRELLTNCPWPMSRLLWLAQFERFAPRFLVTEIDRRRQALEIKTEVECSAPFPELAFRLHGFADRIDIRSDGTAAIFDYKTGALPSQKQQEHFDKQLLLEAALLERGWFEGITEMPVSEAEFLAINEGLKSVSAPLKTVSADETWSQLQTLLAKWNLFETGYSARIALYKKEDISQYDHLSRFGEWTTSDPVEPKALS